MNDDYLWDRTGKDPEVEKLEGLLRPAAFSPARSPLPAVRPPRAGGAPPWSYVLALAAGIVMAVGLAATREKRATVVVPPPPIAEARTLDLGKYGELHAEAGAVLHEIRRDDDEIRFRLERGTIHASITLEARPRLFQVETPATTCVDLGCKYTLAVDADGATTVHVETGRVAFQNGAREVFVPAGATCRARRGAGSGTPHADDAPPALVAAVRAYDEAAPAGRAAAAHAVLRAAALPGGALTLWHLLQDDDRGVRMATLDMLTAASGSPVDAPRDRTLARDPEALESWKQHLGLDPFGGFRK